MPKKYTKIVPPCTNKKLKMILHVAYKITLKNIFYFITFKRV